MRQKPWITALFLALAMPAVPTSAADATPSAFPGAVGPAAATPGGRGGQILRVTTLAPDGPGSLKAAIETPGPRIVVFEVGGVIDMGRETIEIKHPYLTIAGQTAPGPGITLIRTGIDVKTHDVESAGLVADRIRRALDVIPAERLIVNPDCGCVHLPRDVAFRKLASMAEGARQVREELSR